MNGAWQEGGGLDHKRRSEAWNKGRVSKAILSLQIFKCLHPSNAGKRIFTAVKL